MLAIAELDKKTSSKYFEITGIMLDCELKFQDYTTNVTFKAKQIMGIT